MSSRRTFFAIAMGVVATAGGGWWLGRASARRGAAEDGAAAVEADANAPRGTLAWALALGQADAETLLSAAGDLERVASRNVGERRLVPVFARVLDLALDSQVGYADTAGACAVRCLERLDALPLIASRAGAITARSGFVQTGREVEFALAPRRPRGGR